MSEKKNFDLTGDTDFDPADFGDSDPLALDDGPDEWEQLLAERDELRDRLMRELKTIGARNATQGRSRGLTTRRRLDAVDWAIAVPFTATMLIGSAVGATFSHRLPAER